MPGEYDLFLSHSHRDAALVESIATQLDELGVSVFLDAWEIGPGTSSVDELQKGMAGSAAVAIFVGANGLGPWHQEEMRQALRLSIDQGKRAFYAWMPGAPKAPEGIVDWLRERSEADLREHVGPAGGVSDRGLALLVAGARGMKPRAATAWLAARRADAAESRGG